MRFKIPTDTVFGEGSARYVDSIPVIMEGFAIAIVISAVVRKNVCVRRPAYVWGTAVAVLLLNYPAVALVVVVSAFTAILVNPRSAIALVTTDQVSPMRNFTRAVIFLGKSSVTKPKAENLKLQSLSRRTILPYGLKQA